ncbi:hypothetical protein SAICODRAFT_19148 [Saitoella complicata NRRL Y-17804]|uniref:uncharacterized protein n=1 Tax=Saitoella complicata (strain BCRC 22490 / CBS 7301 / JCM 7358 / NBRC 10748 / NRRL Y-17804) TaxID=698492 RepID=UPI00086746BD|nr:uncharacterized protein SAICODRAFT_19148 [Saitoella complicata NRRL Y-17804]ODQ53220.1 hypothetical protein SAICODRAFT_19148 [Saitoella complicata NRRL Y-17804]
MSMNTQQTPMDDPEAVKNVQRLDRFLNESPRSNYTFDSERDSDESTVCRRVSDGGLSCVKLRLNSKQMFEQMQKFGYFCALPLDPSRTELECKKF